MIEVLALIGCLILMTLFVAGSLWYFRRIRDGRADPLVNPSWTTDMRPPSPQDLDWNLDSQGRPR
ncbi:hypothetical protein [Mycolicibacterium palauense]|uniref:hypothetical protein n=1 Tax=Mycolicibacterium palauense TaxID=2034511 RepID=UPI000BFF1339|nr:hypothetical protein [Mycolicibacterium palauense]